MTPDGLDLAVGITITLLRIHIVYLLYIGWFELSKLGNKCITWAYTLGVTIYLFYVSLSSIGIDAAHPSRIIGLGGLAICIQVLVRSLHTSNSRHIKES